MHPLLPRFAAIACLSLTFAGSAAAALAAIPPIGPGDHVRGAAQGRVILVEYADFQGPYSQRFHGTLRAILAKHPKDVRWVYRHYPLPFFEHDRPSAIAGECVARLAGNDAFWKFADAIFAQEGDLPGDYVALAAKSGASGKAFQDCIALPAVAKEVDADVAGTAGLVDGTPSTFVIDARKPSEIYAHITGAYSEERVGHVVQDLLDGKPAPDSFAAPEATAPPSEPPPPPPAEPSGELPVVPRVSPTDHVKGPASAKLTLVEYGGFQDPFSRKQHETMAQLLARYPRDIRWVYRNYPLAFQPQSQTAGEAGECVVQTAGNDAFWRFADLVFREEQLPADYAELARAAGASKVRVETCIAQGGGKTAVQAGAEGIGAVDGTPTTFFIDNATGKLVAQIAGAYPLEDFAQTVDALLAGKTPERFQPRKQIRGQDSWDLPAPSGEPAPAADLPKVPKPGKNEAVRGSRSAPLTIVEYGDLDDPFTRRAHPTMRKLLKTYGGKVNWIFRHYPLSFHPEALPGAIAAECVRAQKGDAAFWTFVDGVLATEKPDAALYARLAAKLKANPAKFRGCLKSPASIRAAGTWGGAAEKAGASGTPNFFILGKDGSYKGELSGAYPYESFVEKIEAALKR